MPFMATVGKALHYVANLEWREKKQHSCKFCDRAQLRNVVLEVSGQCLCLFVRGGENCSCGGGKKKKKKTDRFVVGVE